MAGILVSNGVYVLTAFVPFLIATVVVIVVINIAGHIVVAMKNRTDEADERDRLIGCLEESRAAWLLGVGVIGAIIALILPVDDFWVAHLLLISLFGSEIVKLVQQVVYYRRGI